jgi:hypothetical protein
LFVSWKLLLLSSSFGTTTTTTTTTHELSFAWVLFLFSLVGNITRLLLLHFFFFFLFMCAVFFFLLLSSCCCGFAFVSAVKQLQAPGFFAALCLSPTAL